MRNIISWEIARRRSFTIWWSIGLTALTSLTILSYASVKDQTKELEKAVGEMSSSVGSFVGGEDLFSPTGYLSSQLYYITLPLLIIIMVLSLTSSLMSKDEKDNTIELSLARPISRLRLMIGKALAGLIIVAIVCLISYASAALSVAAVDIDVSQKNLFITHIMSFVFSLSFAAIAFALMAFSKLTQNLSKIIAILISFGSYMIVSLSGMVTQLEPIAKVLPFQFYDTAEMLNGKVQINLILYLLITFILSAVIAIYGYTRRDIG